VYFMTLFEDFSNHLPSNKAYVAHELLHGLGSREKGNLLALSRDLCTFNVTSVPLVPL
jgi:hypothetical protein